MLYIWSNYSDLTSKGSWGRETSIFQGNLDWWNIMKYYDLGRYWYIDTAFFPTRLCYAILYYTLLYYYTRLWYATPCYTTVLYYTILYCTILSFTLLYYRILYYTVPCHTSQEQYYILYFSELHGSFAVLIPKTVYSYYTILDRHASHARPQGAESRNLQFPFFERMADSSAGAAARDSWKAFEGWACLVGFGEPFFLDRS